MILLAGSIYFCRGQEELNRLPLERDASTRGQLNEITTVLPARAVALDQRKNHHNDYHEDE